MDPGLYMENTAYKHWLVSVRFSPSLLALHLLLTDPHLPSSSQAFAGSFSPALASSTPSQESGHMLDLYCPRQ